MVGHLFILRRYEAVLSEISRLRELFDRDDYGQWFVASSSWQLNQREKALEEFRKVWSADAELLRAVGAGYAEAGPEGAMRVAADYAARNWDPGRGNAYSIASSYARAGAIDTSLEWLERAHGERELDLLHVVADPTLDPLRSDLRFQALLRRIGLPP